MPIAAFLTMTARPGSEEELLARFTDVIADVRTEPGNLMAVVLRDPKEPGQFHEFVIYKDQAAIEAHRAAEHSVKKGPLVQELTTGPYKAQLFDTVDWPDSLKLPS